ncbi:hypothetical protein BTUL_0194g00140 [Botrytis tulipae]|uniref:Uncharacterized protein n=1 Tax=Botrytis tulipae TaxID=87230 RepID=A0A4Z1E950_9HELO|nr:hypothetical protein BTUL_0194g00140 [Botrytis tulipae]
MRGGGGTTFVVGMRGGGTIFVVVWGGGTIWVVGVETMPELPPVPLPVLVAVVTGGGEVVVTTPELPPVALPVRELSRVVVRPDRVPVPVPDEDEEDEEEEEMEEEVEEEELLEVLEVLEVLEDDSEVLLLVLEVDVRLVVIPDLVPVEEPVEELDRVVG